MDGVPYAAELLCGPARNKYLKLNTSTGTKRIFLKIYENTFFLQIWHFLEYTMNNIHSEYFLFLKNRFTCVEKIEASPKFLSSQQSDNA